MLYSSGLALLFEYCIKSPQNKAHILYPICVYTQFTTIKFIFIWFLKYSPVGSGDMNGWIQLTSLNLDSLEKSKEWLSARIFILNINLFTANCCFLFNFINPVSGFACKKKKNFIKIESLHCLFKIVLFSYKSIYTMVMVILISCILIRKHLAFIDQAVNASFSWKL